ncbi:MAG: hypothetical protein ATN36_05015 [Epulopiscium sp. Nele67-Bin005]|nr:MAG: hypothetical protein ATN36_05015 [Epulopiscium sp. Nele67-Bin005]
MKETILELVSHDENIKDKLQTAIITRFVNESSKEDIGELVKQLASDDIIYQIREINDEEIIKLKSKFEVASNRVQQLLKERTEVDEQIVQLENENKSLQSKVQEQETVNATLREKVDYLENQTSSSGIKFSKSQFIFNIYESLDPATKSNLEGVFKQIDSIDKFLMCGAEFERLEMLWDFIAHTILHQPNKTTLIKNLTDIFNYFFDIYIQIHPMYSWLKVESGTEFDTDIHIKIGKSGGSIKKVKLRGIQNIYTKKVLKKSIVEL